MMCIEMMRGWLQEVDGSFATEVRNHYINQCAPTAKVSAV